MNAKQRRQLNRKTKYKVTITRNHASESWIQYDDRSEKAIEWVKKNCKGEYHINKIGSKYTCTCPGFAFRHKCKHVDDLK